MSRNKNRSIKLLATNAVFILSQRISQMGQIQIAKFNSFKYRFKLFSSKKLFFSKLFCLVVKLVENEIKNSIGWKSIWLSWVFPTFCLFRYCLERSFNANMHNTLCCPLRCLYMYHILLYITFKRRDLSSLLGFPSQTDVEPWTHAPLRIVYMNAPIQYINQFLLFDVHVHIHAIWINVITIHSHDKIKPYLWAQHVANEH